MHHGRTHTARQAPVPQRLTSHKALLAIPLALLAGACAPQAEAVATGEAPSQMRREATTLHPVTVNQPAALGALDTGIDPATGKRTGIACATCHGPTRDESFAAGAKPDIHAGVRLSHGELRCDACHDPQDRSRLRLADGRDLSFSHTMQLCGQCHGPQMRDYGRGAHGGMAGFWDLSRGPRTRNNCLDCHSAHAPAYPQVMPAAPPRDRGSARAKEHR